MTNWGTWRQYPSPEPGPEFGPRCPRCGERMNPDAPWCFDQVLEAGTSVIAPGLVMVVR